MKARFSRKKSSSKKTPPLEPDPFRSPPSVPSLDFKLPSSDFRSSRILPDLGKRFSLLARTEDPSVIKHKLAQLRHAGSGPTLTQEEEDIVFRELQQLREDQIGGSSSSIQSPTGISSVYSVQSPSLLDRSVASSTHRSENGAAPSPSSSNFFGGLSNEKEYIRKAKRSASSKNLADAAGEKPGGSRAGRRRAASSQPQADSQEQEQPPPPPLSKDSHHLPTSDSMASFVSEADSTMEILSPDDVLSQEDDAPSTLLRPAATDRSKRQSLLDALSPAQVKRISTTLTLLENSLFSPPLLPDNRSNTSRSASPSPSPLPGSRAQSPSADQVLATVVEPPMMRESGEYDVEASEELMTPEQSPPPRKGRVASASGYKPGPRPIKNRSLSTSSNPPQPPPMPLASPAPSFSHLSPNPTSEAAEQSPSVFSDYLSTSHLDPATSAQRLSFGSQGSQEIPQVLVGQIPGFVTSPLDWHSQGSSDKEDQRPLQSPSSSRVELRGTRDYGRDTFFFNQTGSQSTHEGGRGGSIGPLDERRRESESVEEEDKAEETFDDTFASADTEVFAQPTRAELEEQLDSRPSSFAHRLPSSLNHPPRTGPKPSMSSMALHGHQTSHSSMSSMAPSTNLGHLTNDYSTSWQRTYDRPESADSDALLPAPIEARYDQAQGSLRSKRSDGSMASSVGGSSFRSSGWEASSTAGLEGPDDVVKDETESKAGQEADEDRTLGAEELEQVLLSSSGIGAEGLALVHQKLVEAQPVARLADSDVDTPRAPTPAQRQETAASIVEGPPDEEVGTSESLTTEKSEDESPTPRLQQIPSPSPSASNHAVAPVAPTHQANQLSRASSILDPELNGSIDALNSFIASEKSGPRSTSSQSPALRQDSPPGPVDSPRSAALSPPNPVPSPRQNQETFSSPAQAQVPLPRSPFSPASPGTVDDPNFVDDFRARIDAADSALKKSPSMPRIVSGSKISRSKSLKKSRPSISQPQLISSTSKVEATAITITPPPLPDRAQTLGLSSSKSMSNKFRSLTGRRKSKENLKESWMQDLPPSPTIGSTPRIPPSWPVSPPLGSAATTPSQEPFKFPARSPNFSRPSTTSPPSSPRDSNGKRTFFGRLRPRKTLDNIATSQGPASPEQNLRQPHTAPLESVRQFSGPSLETTAEWTAPEQNHVVEHQRSTSFQSGHSHVSSVHALFDAASKLGIDAQDVDALLRRSNSVARTYDSRHSLGGTTPPLTRAPSNRSIQPVDSIVEEPQAEQTRTASNGTLPLSISAQSGLSQSSALSGSGSVMRRTVILPKDNGRLSFQNLPRPDSTIQSPAKSGFPRSPAKARLSDYAPSEAPHSSPRNPLDDGRPSLSPTDTSFSRAGHSSANASLFDLYHGQVEDEDEAEEYLPAADEDESQPIRQSLALSTTSHTQPGQAIEILEMSNGDVLYSVLQGLRDIEDVEDFWETRSDAASMVDRPPSSVMDEPLHITFREGQRHDNYELPRRRSIKPVKAPRPETKIFYSSSKAVADLISEISRGHDQGQLQFVTSASPTSPSIFSNPMSASSLPPAPLNVPKRSVSIKRPSRRSYLAPETDPRFSDAPSHNESEYSTSSKLDRMMDSVLASAQPDYHLSPPSGRF